MPCMAVLTLVLVKGALFDLLYRGRSFRAGIARVFAGRFFLHGC